MRGAHHRAHHHRRLGASRALTTPPVTPPPPGELVTKCARGALYARYANRLEHNVAICPWAREGPRRGCTVPGTDNVEADTSLNQAGLWALSITNHLIGNRFSNSFNGARAAARAPPSATCPARLASLLPPHV